MAAVLGNSPELACASIFKSPLHSLRAEACERAFSEDIYADSQARLTQWRKDLVSSAKFEAQQGLRDLQHEHEHVKDLRGDLAGVQGLVEAASHLQAGGARLAEVVNSSSEAAGSRAQAMTRICDELHESCEMHKQTLQKVEDNIAKQQAAAESHHAEALKLISTYRDRLGLAITRVAPQTVRMAFSLLDQCDPGREVFFILGLGDSEGYRVSECVPHVPELKGLLEDLNADANNATSLPRFVCGMRRAFLKIVVPPTA